MNRRQAELAILSQRKATQELPKSQSTAFPRHYTKAIWITMEKQISHLKPPTHEQRTAVWNRLRTVSTKNCWVCVCVVAGGGGRGGADEI